MAIGERMYGLATVATILALGVLWALQWAERLIRTPIYRTVTIRARADASTEVLDSARTVLSRMTSHILDIKVAEDVATATTEIELSVRANQTLQAHDTIKALARIHGVLEARWH